MLKNLFLLTGIVFSVVINGSSQDDLSADPVVVDDEERKNTLRLLEYMRASNPRQFPQMNSKELVDGLTRCYRQGYLGPHNVWSFMELMNKPIKWNDFDPEILAGIFCSLAQNISHCDTMPKIKLKMRQHLLTMMTIFVANGALEGEQPRNLLIGCVYLAQEPILYDECFVMAQKVAVLEQYFLGGAWESAALQADLSSEKDNFAQLLKTLNSPNPVSKKMALSVNGKGCLSCLLV